MPEKVYLMLFEDGCKSGAREILLGMSACVLSADEASIHGILVRFKDAEIIAVALGDGRKCPSKHLRLNESADVALARGFVLPSPLIKAIEGRKIPVVIVRPKSFNTLELKVAFQNLHFRNAAGKWTGSVSANRKVRKRRHIEKRKQRSREDYTDPYLCNC